MPEKRPKLDQALTASNSDPHLGRREAQRRERVERMLGTDLRQKLERWPDLNFNYQAATAFARRSQPTPGRSQSPRKIDRPSTRRGLVGLARLRKRPAREKHFLRPLLHTLKMR